MDNEKIDDLFDMEKMGKTIKKAKRRASWKTILVTIVVTIVVIVLGATFNRTFSILLEKPIYNSITGFHQISAPNEFIGEHETYPSILGGENHFKTYKIIEGKVVYTGEKGYGYGLFRDEVLNRQGMTSTMLISKSHSEEDLEKQHYNELGQREMVFFYPFLKYKNYRNDLNLLEDIGQGKVMEVALSFDKVYSFNEVKSMIPKQITTSWLWVDDVYEDKVENYQGTVMGEISYNLVRSEHTVYGVSLINENGDIQEEPVQNFLGNIVTGKRFKARWQGEFNRLFTTLSGEDEKLTEEDLQYFGAVVTGDAQTLSQLKGLPFIKASSIGVITDKY